MDGLTNIIAKIHEQNDAECNSVFEAAKQKADALMAEAEKTAEAAVLAIEHDAEKRCSVINSKAVSTADVEYKRAVLAKKSEILDKVVSDIIEEIKNSSADVYFGYIEKLILSNALTGSGVLKMSSKDIERMPVGFLEKVNSLLPEGKTISVSNDNVPFDGGFVIEYAEMRVDCTFSSLVYDMLDEIRDELSRVLFA